MSHVEEPPVPGASQTSTPKPRAPAPSALQTPLAPAPRLAKEPCRVNAENPSVSLPAGERYRLIVKGCGPVPARLKKKRPLVNVRVMGKQYALIRWGVTCDGEAILPLRVVRVCIDLADPSADVEVIVEQRPPRSRAKKAPDRWETSLRARPTLGGYQPPKAAFRRKRIPSKTQ